MKELLEAFKALEAKLNVGEEIGKLEKGEYFQYPVNISADRINKVLVDGFGIDSYIEEDINGCDMDWSTNFEFEGRSYNAWGSLTSASFLIQYEG